MIKYLLTSFLLLVFQGSSFAQDSDLETGFEQEKNIFYVTDQLRLSLYQQADGQSGVIQLLSSGDKLIVEQSSGAYALVTTHLGNKGWVKRGFLVSKPTANLLLEEEIAKNSLLTAEIEKLQNSKQVIEQYEKDLLDMNRNVNTLESEKEILAQIVDDLNAELERIDQEAKLEAERKISNADIIALKNAGIAYWQYLAAALVLFMLIIFYISKALIEARIKRKFQGIKIW